MHCDDIQQQISAFIDEELPSSDVKELLDHCATCKECEQALQDMIELDEHFIQPAPVPREKELWHGIQSKIAPKPARRLVSYLGAAAAIIVLAAAAQLVWQMRQDRVQDPVVPSHVVEAPTHEEQIGTNLCLAMIHGELTADSLNEIVDQESSAAAAEFLLDLGNEELK